MRHIGIIAIIALLTVGILAFATPSKSPDNPQTSKNTYETMWKKVKDNLEKNLPESAEKELDAIEQQALKDKNQEKKEYKPKAWKKETSNLKQSKLGGKNEKTENSTMKQQTHKTK